jgi:hypothetical protein
VARTAQVLTPLAEVLGPALGISDAAELAHLLSTLSELDDRFAAAPDPAPGTRPGAADDGRASWMVTLLGGNALVGTLLGVAMVAFGLAESLPLFAAFGACIAVISLFRLVGEARDGGRPDRS